MLRLLCQLLNHPLGTPHTYSLTTGDRIWTWLLAACFCGTRADIGTLTAGWVRSGEPTPTWTPEHRAWVH